ncbi:uncharacterized protein LOC113290501 [Papaver somniferum]|uniref:uncharacterized protein LOC113290501 n=1 Tax=Papaver somniferum TaxID=3469 RepID=UPI000E703179|nr:uncharacterized protein LOC113290501 [Papaver somniferum]
MEVKRNAASLFISQTKYAIDLLQKFDMAGAKECSSPVPVNSTLKAGDGELLSNPTMYKSLVSASKYLTWTRPEISYAINQVCQFIHSPTSDHLIAAKRILSYIKGTLDYGILFSKGLLAVHGFSDEDWARDPETRKSTSGYCIFFGSNPVSWSSKRQSTVARSSTEAEYRSLANSAAELMWICQLLKDLEVVQAKNLSIQYICTVDQVADIFTKELAGPRFGYLCNKLMVFPAGNLNLRGGNTTVNSHALNSLTISIVNYFVVPSGGNQ